MYAQAFTVSMYSPTATKFSPLPHFLAPCTQSKSLLYFSKSKSGYCNLVKRVSESQRSSRNGNGHVVVNVRCEGSPMENDNDDGFYIRRCVELARKAVGCTSPNPMVGCVIVKDGRIVGEGFHPKAGQPHAEVFALRDAGNMAEDATAYVSLEPCNHYGRTPPCTEALIKAKVKKVVVGMVDPNPIVDSKGLDRLREAGIEVTVGVEEELCQKLNEAFVHKMLTGKPFVTLRYTISLDGHLSNQLGEKVMESGGYYSRLLQENDAVIHSSTSVAENPSVLSSKEPGANQPLNILLAVSPNLPNVPPALTADATPKLIIFTEKETAAAAPDSNQRAVETVVLDRMNLTAILDHCKRQGLCSVMLDVRGNSTEFEGILREGFEQSLFQKVVMEVLPVWGGSDVFKNSGLNLKVKNLTTRVSGNSVLLEGYF
ncbi:riboflavin biosynthesis protein PYRD, chloroplastic [Ipomoea triloba]|uniref:riboflavin biosynthesis protein PYRD, chloroplastic n=1 Tax=Ipomoea triloba TaxID=35885 RepID=UPI00125E65EA|nr:riboflavin biosynthesis protein PYRD, chloroplastic [Ipomoea triloba]XP_031103752.1 riboflavin biosynthesis protein PYRD, chloroplastic [Ipomoea triloba]XP_031103753.1 riboflavin biosynthesis protein PYRD, chloroplastic [Ipomoea triloba]XP_031103754.1 riboflavin biosynthesis protein PYRD, chloroplastic [Ipomoea triloba]